MNDLIKQQLESILKKKGVGHYHVRRPTELMDQLPFNVCERDGQYCQNRKRCDICQKQMKE